MEISRMLLKPYVERLVEDFRQIEEELEQHTTPEAAQLKALLQRKNRQLEMLNLAVSYLHHDTPELDPKDLYASLRRLKLELRFARRKWKRLLSNEIRTQRNQDKRSHVDTFAA